MPDEIMKISDVIKKLVKIKEERGDLKVFSVNYHSDFKNVPLLKENHFEGEEQFEFVDSDYSYLLIYGGSR